MRDIILHKWIMTSGVVLTVVLMLLALLVFDFTLALVLFGIVLVLPPLGVLLVPGERPRAPWQAGLLALAVMGIPLIVFVQDGPTSDRTATLLSGLANKPAASWAWLEHVYTSMPGDSARHPIVLPEGSVATAGRNLDLLNMLEEPEKQ
ncbi:MAG: hypothetical protein KI792_04850 [Alphaproteobacteria bacterium]|nr:hypothetical protein [Alphaproteobacteria bacterium SS10]